MSYPPIIQSYFDFWQSTQNMGGFSLLQGNGVAFFKSPEPDATMNFVYAQSLKPNHFDFIQSQRGGHGLTWYVESDKDNQDLFAKAGFVLKEEAPEMVMDFSGLPPIPALDGFLVEKVLDDSAFTQWVIEAGHVFDMSKAEVTSFLAPAFGFGRNQNHFYIAKYKGQPIGTALVVWGKEWASLFWVAIREEWRGRGYAFSLIIQALKEAEQAGLSKAVLLAETKAVSLYHRVGFKIHQYLREYAIEQ